MPKEPFNIPKKKAWSVSHSLTNPFNGGSAEMAIDPIKNAAAVQGMVLISPPNFSISCLPVALYILPAHKKRSPLNIAWFIR